MSLRGMKPEFKVGDLYCYKYDDAHYYLCSSPHQSHEVYPDTQAGRNTFRLAHPYFGLMFVLGQVWCADVPALIKIRDYLDMKEE